MRNLKRLAVLLALPAAFALASCGHTNHGQGQQPAAGPQAPAAPAHPPGAMPPAQNTQPQQAPKPAPPATAGSTLAPASTAPSVHR